MLESVRYLVTMSAVVLAFAASSEVAAQASCPRVELTLIDTRDSPETRPVQLGDATVFVRRNAITTTGDISEIEVARDNLGDDGDVFIQIKYIPEAAARLLDATTDRDGQRMAFVVDDDVWLAFTWEGPYGIGPNGTQLSIRNGMARARALMASIRNCSAD